MKKICRSEYVKKERKNKNKKKILKAWIREVENKEKVARIKDTAHRRKRILMPAYTHSREGTNASYIF
jgi:hypothetical protein